MTSDNSTEPVRIIAHKGLNSKEAPPNPSDPQHPCLICGKVDADKAMAFIGEDWCCENHRKRLEGEV